MELAGYIKEFKEVMFTIPVYSDGINHYFHRVDDDYIITQFEEISGTIEHFISIDNDLSFRVGEKASIVFKGKDDFLIYDRMSDGIIKVRDYFNNEINPGEFVNAEEDVQYFESLI